MTIHLRIGFISSTHRESLWFHNSSHFTKTLSPLPNSPNPPPTLQAKKGNYFLPIP